MPLPEIREIPGLPDGEFPIVAHTQRPAVPLRVLKYGDTFAVFDQHGHMVATEAQEAGLYYHGTRYLSRFEFLIADRRPLLLSSTVSDDNVVFAADLTNVDVKTEERLDFPHGEIHLFVTRVLSEGISIDRLRLSNHGLHTLQIPLAVHFGADYADVFEVRGTRRARRGRYLPPTIGAECVIGYEGLDRIVRRTLIRWSRQPDHLEAGLALYDFLLEPHATVAFEITIRCQEQDAAPTAPDYESALGAARKAITIRTGGTCTVRSSSESMNRWLKRSAADLQMMITETPEGQYPYAGIPWFSTPFGRDGLITALELLWADPKIARGVLGFLAATQATTRSDPQDAAPGKILHEMRLGEMAALGEVPFGRYYGSVDSTPLFVVLADAYYRRTSDAPFIDQLWPHVLAALEWMKADGDPDRDGFLEYARQSENGLVQQGWKDSSDSVFHADGALAKPPIALCEVQGYAYAAWRGAADLAAARNDQRAAREWNERADRLRTKFEEMFWSNDLGTYALALDGQKRPCLVRSSNAAHCLFTGIVSAPDRARRVMQSLMDEASFTGWGIRTIAAGEARYNPMSYHNGSIWPHDNAVAAAGFARYGFTAAASTLMDTMLELSRVVDLHRLPELLCGFRRRSDERPTLYPVACAPQAWAAGAVYLLIQSMLGMDIDARARRITFVRASLPESIEWLRLINLSVGTASVELMLERHGSDVAVSVWKRDGDVEIVSVK